MAEDPKEFDRQLDQLENGIVLLKREVEIYLAGASKKPPTDSQAKLDKAIKRYYGAQGLSYAQRFRYNTLLAKFNSYNELWNKQLRLKEEGRLPIGAPVPSPPPARAPHRPPAHAPENPMERVFKDYIRTRETTGEGSPQMNFDGFAQILAKQREALIGKYHCKDVQFYVTVEDGKTKLKARPLK
jgi:hypothetical protein